MIEVLGVVLMGGSLLFALLLLGIFVVTPQPRKKLPSECKFLDIHSGNGAERDFPSLLAQPTSSNKAKGELQQVELTVVVPAFREVDRLPGMLDRTLQFLRSSSEFSSSFEIIVVDDGSQDETYNSILHCK
jgi:dolichyl-phosphate beta-glucosyltransferase